MGWNRNGVRRGCQFGGDRVEVYPVAMGRTGQHRQLLTDDAVIEMFQRGKPKLRPKVRPVRRRSSGDQGGANIVAGIIQASPKTIVMEIVGSKAIDNAGHGSAGGRR